MSETDKSPIVGRRTVLSSHQVVREPVGHIVSRRKIDLAEGQSNESISLADKLPEQLQKVINEIIAGAPAEWRQQAQEAAYFIWSLDSAKQIHDSNGQSLEDKRQKFVDQLITTGFIWQVYNRASRWAVDPYKSLPNWLATKNNSSTEQLNDLELQQVRAFYNSYVTSHATEHVSPDGQRYFDYTQGVPQKETETFVGTHRSKGYIEGVELRDTERIEKALSQLRSHNIHPHTTKLFDGDRLVLYWDSQLTDEQKSQIESSFGTVGVKMRAFAQDVPEVNLTEAGYKVEVRASNDGSLGEGGHNPFDWEEPEYNAEIFLKKYLQLTYWAGKNPTEPYRLSFVPIITSDVPDSEQRQTRIAEIQRKIAETDHLPTVVSESSYLNCFAT